MIAALFLLAFFFQQPPALKAISSLASALSEGNPASAMSVFDRALPNYNELSSNVYALTSQADLSCSIDPVGQTGNEVEVDWFLLIRSKQENGPAERRQVTVKLTLTPTGKAWKIVAINPSSILDPPKF